MGRAFRPPQVTFCQMWVTKSVFTGTVLPMSEDLMLPKMARMVVSASLPDTSGSRSCTSASTNSSITPEDVGMLSKL